LDYGTGWRLFYIENFFLKKYFPGSFSFLKLKIKIFYWPISWLTNVLVLG